MRAAARYATRFGILLALGAIAGCGGGGGDAESHTSASSGGAASRRTAAPSTAYVSSGGGGGPVGESFGSVHSAHPRLGGVGGALQAQELRRIAAIERAHRPPGPQRLTGVDEDAQELQDFIDAAAIRPISSGDADSCERTWDQNVATTEAFHTAQHDGLHSPVSDSDRTAFLATCRAQSPEMQQCGDPAYLAQHMDECEQVRERAVRDARRQTHPTGPTEPVDRDPLDSFDE